MTKFGSDAAKARVLLSLPQHFDLDVYTASRGAQQFNATLKHLTTAFQRHADRDLLKTCAATLENFCASELPLAQKAEAAVDGLRVMLVEAVEAVVADGVPVDDDDSGASGEPGPKSFQVNHSCTTSLPHVFLTASFPHVVLASSLPHALLTSSFTHTYLSFLASFLASFLLPLRTRTLSHRCSRLSHVSRPLATSLNCPQTISCPR